MARDAMQLQAEIDLAPQGIDAGFPSPAPAHWPRDFIARKRNDTESIH